MKTIQELNQEISKHRKLLHRAVGNQILSHINYHHYEIVRLIGLVEQEKENNRDNTKYVFGSPLAELLGRKIIGLCLKSEEDVVLRGVFNIFTTDTGGNHNDIHASKTS